MKSKQAVHKKTRTKKSTSGTTNRIQLHSKRLYRYLRHQYCGNWVRQCCSVSCFCLSSIGMCLAFVYFSLWFWCTILYSRDFYNWLCLFTEHEGSVIGIDFMASGRGWRAIKQVSGHITISSTCSPFFSLCSPCSYFSTLQLRRSMCHWMIALQSYARIGASSWVRIARSRRCSTGDWWRESIERTCAALSNNCCYCCCSCWAKAAATLETRCAAADLEMGCMLSLRPSCVRGWKHCAPTAPALYWTAFRCYPFDRMTIARRGITASRHRHGCRMWPIWWRTWTRRTSFDSQRQLLFVGVELWGASRAAEAVAVNRCYSFHRRLVIQCSYPYETRY